MVFLLCFWALLLGAAAKFEDATTGRMPACVLSVKGRKGVGREREGGGEKGGGRKNVHANGGDRDTGFTTIFSMCDVQCLISPCKSTGGACCNVLLN